MCIAIYNPYGTTVSKKELKNCYHSNPDGMGMMYIKDGEIQIEKELRSFRKFYRSYRKVITDDIKTDIVLHFRIGTGGNIDLANCHPFMVSDEVAFCHNGILSYGKGWQDDKSDTVVFNEEVLKGLPKDFITNKSIMHLIEQEITGSKMIFMDKWGRVTIANESDGHWYNKCWFSNWSYLTHGNMAMNNTINLSGFKNYDKKESTLSSNVNSVTDFIEYNMCWNCGKAVAEDERNSYQVCPTCYDSYHI